MHQKYAELFTELVHSAELIAEQVMEYDKKKNDERGMKTAQIMRDDYAKFYDKIRAKDFDFNTLKKADYAKILVATFIIANNMQDQITNMQNVLNGYQQDIIPKLQKVMKVEEEDKMAEMANEVFQITDETK